MNPTDRRLQDHLLALRLHRILAQYEALRAQAAKENWTHVDYLARLLDAESAARDQRALERRLAAARFPVVKTLEQFQWNWPKKINRTQVTHLFRLGFVKDKTKAIFVGGVGLGKTHLATALGHAAAMAGHSVRFASAVDIVNTLTIAQVEHRLKVELKRYLQPEILVVDELGYLPIDKHGADLLFQVISQRYERGSLILTTNQPYKNWAKVFNDDATLTSAVLDRLLHHAEAVIVEGRSYRMKDQIDAPE